MDMHILNLHVLLYLLSVSGSYQNYQKMLFCMATELVYEF